MKIFKSIFKLTILVIVLGCGNNTSSKIDVPPEQINKQKESNRLFSAEDFISFIGNVDNAEGKLLKGNFSFSSSHTKLKIINWVQYRLNHSYNTDTNFYEYDNFSVSNDLERVVYSTSSGKNYQAYKEKLIEFGFTKTSTDLFKKTIGMHDFEMLLERNGNESPTYIIKINKE